MLQVSSKERKKNNDQIFDWQIFKKKVWSTIEGSCGSYCTTFIYGDERWNQIEITF